MKNFFIILSFYFTLCTISICDAVRIKDIASFSGVRSNELIGYGLIVGLDGTGDNNDFTGQSFKTMLSRFGIQLPNGVTATSKNIAAVALSATLPAFAKPGQKIDVTASSIGSSKSLRGGTLLLSYLKGIDGNVYAVAQGNLVVGGFGAEGKDGSQIKVNVPVVGRIANGATVEVAAPNGFTEEPKISILLHRADFTTAKRMSDSINEFMGHNTASPVDSGTIDVNIPLAAKDRVRFLSVVENLWLETGTAAAKIVINSRTGTIVIGKNVRVGPAAVSHGSLTVTITEKINVSQPVATTTNIAQNNAPVVDADGTLTSPGGATIASKESNIYASQPNSKMFSINQSVSLDDIVRSVNEVGASPGDLMAILEALKAVGALEAELEII